MKLLIVEDDLMWQFKLQMMLEETCAFQIVKTANLAAAKNALHTETIDLILCDVVPTYATLAICYSRLKKYTTCLYYLNQAEGNYQEAYRFLKQAKTIDDSTFSKDKMKAVQELTVKYEIEKIENQNKDLLAANELASVKATQYVVFAVVLLLGLLAVSVLAVKLKNSNTKLKTAIEEIEQLNKSREHFFAIIAHDLRHPVSALRGTAELVSYYLKTRRFEVVAQIAGQLDKASFEIQQLLDNLLTWALSQNSPMGISIESQLGSGTSYLLRFRQ